MKLIKTYYLHHRKKEDTAYIDRTNEQVFPAIQILKKWKRLTTKST